jgi:hypothetical protein
MLYVGPISVDGGSVRIRLNMYHHLCLTVSIVKLTELIIRDSGISSVSGE